MTAIFWFRQDLRIVDNPGLSAASRSAPVLPVYILDDTLTHAQQLGSASRCWLDSALRDLDNHISGNLVVRQGSPMTILKQLVKQHQVTEVNWNRCYEPWVIKRDKLIKNALEKIGVRVNTFGASLLWEPWEIKNKQGDFYKVFTPFYRKGCLQAPDPRQPLPKPKITWFKHKKDAKKIDQLNLLSGKSWEKHLLEKWDIGEKAAMNKLKSFLRKNIGSYAKGRDYPSQNSTSHLSPYLHWGHLSPHQLWWAVKGCRQDANTDMFLSELGWREFSYYQLFHYPQLPRKNIKKKFDNFLWSRNKKYLTAWKRGETGYPIVDAAMRELYQTGYMHNRMRMITASFLVKNLMQHWRSGLEWFHDCLFDADVASNSAGWQWVAGCGADAAPFFRIFNPIAQAKKFDSSGDYIRHYVPELSDLDSKYLAAPFDAPKSVLDMAGLHLGKNYPNPIVDLAATRRAALAAYQLIK